MTEIAETRWMGNMAFEATIDGFPVRMDTTPGLGGTGHEIRQWLISCPD